MTNPSAILRSFLEDISLVSSISRDASVDREPPLVKWENDDELRFEVDLPGVKLSDICLTAVDGRITLSASRCFGSKKSHSSKSQFSRSVAVDPTTSDLTKMKANLSDGVLVITVPKKEKPKPWNVLITANSQPDVIEASSTSDESSDAKSKILSFDESTETEYCVGVELPGIVKLSDISLIVNDGVITLSTSRPLKSKTGKQEPQVIKTLSIDQTIVDISKLKANVLDGFVILTAPKKVAKPEPYKITTNPQKRRQPKKK